MALRRCSRSALEAWKLLGALAAPTRRLWLGVMVTSNRLRNHAVLAKMAATVDVVPGGRLDFGIGAGGGQLPGAPEALAGIVRREFEAYGVPIVPAGEAVATLDEACTLTRRMWTEDGPFDSGGRYYQLRGAVCEPRPVQQPHPPFVIGAGGERAALRVAARHADIWNCPARTAAEFRHKSRVPDAHCAATGRDPAESTRRCRSWLLPGTRRPPARCCWSSSRRERTWSSRPCRRGPAGRPSGWPTRSPGRSRPSSPGAEQADSQHQALGFLAKAMALSRPAAQ